MREILILVAMLPVWGVAGTTIVRIIAPDTPRSALLVFGPGLLVGTMLHTAADLIRILVGLDSPWASMALLAPCAVLGLRSTSSARLPMRQASSDGASALGVVGLTCLGIGYGRPVILGAGLVGCALAWWHADRADAGIQGLEPSTADQPAVASRLGAGLVAIALLLLVDGIGRDDRGGVGLAEGLHQNLALGVSDLGGVDRLLDRDLRYHWFGHLFIGSVTRLLDLSPFVAGAALIPLIAFIGTASACLSLAGSGSRRVVSGIALGVVLIAGASSFDQLIFGTDRQSVNLLATSWLVALTALAVRRIGPSVSSPTDTHAMHARLPAHLVFGGLVAVLGGAKFSHAIVLVVITLGLAATRGVTLDRLLAVGGAVAGIAVAYLGFIRDPVVGRMVGLLPLREAISLILPLPGVVDRPPVVVLIPLAAILTTGLFVARSPHLLLVGTDSEGWRVAAALTVSGLIAASPTLVASWGEERNLYWLSGAMTSVAVASSMWRGRPAGSDSTPPPPSMILAAGSVGLLVIVPSLLRMRYERRDAERIEQYWNALTVLRYAWPALVVLIGVAVYLRRRPHRRGVDFVRYIVVALTAQSLGLYLVAGGLDDVVRRWRDDGVQRALARVPSPPSEQYLAATWIRDQPRPAAIRAATNVTCGPSGCPGETYTLGAVSRIPVLWEGAIASYLHFDPRRYIDDAGSKQAVVDAFASSPSTASAAALRRFDVRWYVIQVGPETAPYDAFCDRPDGWSCVATFGRTHVIDLTPTR